MSTLATFCTIVAALNGIILLGACSPVNAYRNFSYEHDLGTNWPVYSDSSVENTTFYYGTCEMNDWQHQKECTLYRVQATFSRGSPKKDECKITLRSESGGIIPEYLIDIQYLSKHRAILRWAQETKDTDVYDDYNLRFSIVDFRNCKVKTTKISNDLNQLAKNLDFYFGDWQKSTNGFSDRDFHSLVYDNKGEDDFEIISFDKMSINKTSIDAEGVASKVNTWLTYPNFLHHPATIFPLSKDKGYLMIEISPIKGTEKLLMTIALIQPNGQRQNLTHIEDVRYPEVSLANGLIGICVYHLNNTAMKCTQFKLGDKEINWFSVSIVNRYERSNIYNLPRGEGFLTRVTKRYEAREADKFLVKVGLDGKVKQFVDPNTKCEELEFYSDKYFEDEQGNYCLSTLCNGLKWQITCFEPKEFKNVTKYEKLKDKLEDHRMIIIE